MDFDERVIKQKNVENAIKRYRLERPKHKPARSAFLLWDGELLPAKYILRLSFYDATGIMPPPETLSGGKASVRVLKELGFEASFKVSENRRPNRNPIKSARRAKLKTVLERHYGNVITEWKNDLIFVPDLSDPSTMNREIKKIFEALNKHRGLDIRGKTGHKLAFDFFVPEVKLSVEFDERQHFTPLRKVSLEEYPANARLGFCKDEWIKLSNSIRAGDNSPIYRDEQRALYDSIRDLMAPQIGLLPVVRVFEEEVAWERTGENCQEAKLFLCRLDHIIKEGAS